MGHNRIIYFYRCLFEARMSDINPLTAIISPTTKKIVDAEGPSVVIREYPHNNPPPIIDPAEIKRCSFFVIVTTLKNYFLLAVVVYYSS